MISASLDAWPRPSRTSHMKTRVMIRYNRRTGTSRDLAATRSTCQTTAHGPCAEFWSGTPPGEGLCQDMYQMPRGRLADLDQAGQPEQRDQCREQRQEPVVG